MDVASFTLCHLGWVSCPLQRKMLTAPRLTSTDLRQRMHSPMGTTVFYVSWCHHRQRQAQTTAFILKDLGQADLPS